MKKRRNPVRRHEVTDPNPMTLPVKFQKPPTLAEQIARYMGAHERYAAEHGEETPEEADDFNVEDEDAPESPHELVYDELLNRELPRYEKVLLDQGRRKFDAELQSKMRADKAAYEAAQKIAAEQQKKSKKKESAPADESQE